VSYFFTILSIFRIIFFRFSSLVLGDGLCQDIETKNKKNIKHVVKSGNNFGKRNLINKSTMKLVIRQAFATFPVALCSY